jgi:hypothetical protein
MHGQGTYTLANGEKYVGEYENDKRHGQGAFTWTNGDKYVGEYKDGKEHGQGTYTEPSGSKYVGQFKNGEMHGQATCTSADGAKYVGEWKNDWMMKGTNYDKDGNVIARSPEDDFGDAVNAHIVGDYATALRKFRLLAEMEGEFAWLA